MLIKLFLLFSRLIADLNLFPEADKKGVLMAKISVLMQLFLFLEAGNVVSNEKYLFVIFLGGILWTSANASIISKETVGTGTFLGFFCLKKGKEKVYFFVLACVET